MEKREVVELASNFAQQRGYDISQYEITAEKIDDEWEVYFQRKSEVYKPRPGDFFTVCIDDKSKSIQQLFEGK